MPGQHVPGVADAEVAHVQRAELLAVAGAAAIVRLEHERAAREPQVDRVIADVVRVRHRPRHAGRPAVNHDQQRIAAARSGSRPACAARLRSRRRPGSSSEPPRARASATRQSDRAGACVSERLARSCERRQIDIRQSPPAPDPMNATRRAVGASARMPLADPVRRARRGARSALVCGSSWNRYAHVRCDAAKKMPFAFHATSDGFFVERVGEALDPVSTPAGRRRSRCSGKRRTAWLIADMNAMRVPSGDQRGLVSGPALSDHHRVRAGG